MTKPPEVPEPPESQKPPTAGGHTWRRRFRRWRHRVEGVTLVVLLAYLVLAYLVLPAAWRHYEHHPALENAPKVALTTDGIPADPLNVAFVGYKVDLVRAMIAAGWKPADPITLRTSAGIVRSVLLGRAYPTAPVSDLTLFGRKQDLAFEQAVGKSAKQRHHVRFWEVKGLGTGEVPLWIGAGTFDRRVGLSHTTAEVTHHISPDVDAERDKIIADLRAAGRLMKVYQVTGVGATLQGRNGGGDWYYTDGEMTVGILAPGDDAPAGPVVLPNPGIVRLKDQAWAALKQILPDGDKPADEGPAPD